jgi:hypothetical protein
MIDAPARRDLLRQGLQLLFWGGIWLLIPLLMGDGLEIHQRGVWIALSTALLLSLNFGLLLPQLYYRRRYLLYFAAGLLLAALFAALTDQIAEGWGGIREPMPAPGLPEGSLRRRLQRPPSYMRYVLRALPFVLAFTGSTLIEITVRNIRQERQAIARQKETLEAELKLLRSQINPHFLFNALNNIYSLALLRPAQAPDALLRLSDMMRYLLYECNAPRVPLRRELEYLRSYVALQQLRDSRGLDVALHLEADRDTYELVPMVLIPFVENAFKHSAIEAGSGFVRIRLAAQEGQLRFEVENSKPAEAQPRDPGSGIGLRNVEKLLALSYPGRHRLQIGETGHIFSVDLSLDLR